MSEVLALQPLNIQSPLHFQAMQMTMAVTQPLAVPHKIYDREFLLQFQKCVKEETQIIEKMKPYICTDNSNRKMTPTKSPVAQRRTPKKPGNIEVRSGKNSPETPMRNASTVRSPMDTLKRSTEITRAGITRSPETMRKGKIDSPQTPKRNPLAPINTNIINARPTPSTPKSSLSTSLTIPKKSPLSVKAKAYIPRGELPSPLSSLSNIPDLAPVAFESMVTPKLGTKTFSRDSVGKLPLNQLNKSGEMTTPTKLSNSAPSTKSSPLRKLPSPLDDHRVAQRQKQIDYGYKTVGYLRYRLLVPKEHRAPDHPRTPRKEQACSKRSWDGQLKKWRRELHRWDPEDKVAFQSLLESDIVKSIVSRSSELTHIAGSIKEKMEQDALAGPKDSDLDNELSSEDDEELEPISQALDLPTLETVAKTLVF